MGNENTSYVLNYKVEYIEDKTTKDVVVFDNKSNFEYYIKFEEEGNPFYKVEIDSTGNFIEYGDKKFSKIAVLKEVVKLQDSLKIELDYANPPSCKEVIYTKINGVTKDSVTISSIEYDYKILPTEIGNNKLEIFIDYYCTDYELKSDYFTLDFEVVKDSLN